MLLIHTARIISGGLVLLVAFSSGQDWFPQTGLMAMLFLLLIGGGVILLVGIRDLVRDLWRLYRA